ncbi:hypothetical protein CSB08_01145 [Candidatus Gracilibacteria bacterium]|nr:MAG: hypothetical protein CSB08_01145 [Candidatus Gracilibacteria bacterium]
MNNIDIFKGNEKEIKQKFEDEGYDWEKIKKELEKVSKKEEVDTQLQKLEGQVNKQYEFLKHQIGDLEKFKKQKEGIVDQAMEKVEDIKDETIERASEEGKNFIERYIPGGRNIMDFFKKISFAYDKFGEVSEKKGFFTAVGVFFGIISGKIGLDYFKKEEDSNNETSSETSENSSEPPENNDNQSEESEENTPETTESNNIGVDTRVEKSDYYYRVGAGLLVSLSGVKLEENTGEREIYTGLENITYEYFLAKKENQSFKDKILGKSKDNEELKKQYEKVSEAFSSENVNNLLRIGLSKEIVRNIFENNKEFFKEKFGEGEKSSFNKILGMLDDGDFDYKKLTFKELSILYIKTIPALTNIKMFAGKKGLETYISSIKGFFGNGIETKEMKENLFSKNLINALLQRSGEGENNGKSEEEMKQKLGLTNNKDIEDFSKIYKFKEYLEGKDFLQNRKVGLNEQQQTIFKSKLNYKWILALYSTMGGNKLDNLSSINLPILVYLISKILSFGNDASNYFVSSNYLKNYAEKIFINNKKEKIFSDDDMIVFEIYKQKIMDMLIFQHMSSFNSFLGFSTDKENMLETGLAIGTGGFILKHFSEKGIKKALGKGTLPFFSKWCKKLGLLGMGAGIVLGGLSMVSKNSDLGKFDGEVKEAYNSGNIDELLNILKKHEDGIKTYKRKEGNEEKEIKTVHYKDSSPYLKYNGKFYLITLLNSTQDAKYGFLNWLKNTINPIASRNNRTINGIDVTKIHIEGDKIVFGENGLENSYFIEINDLISGDWKTDKINLDVSANIESWIEYFDEDWESIFGEGKTKDFIDTGFRLGNNNEFIVSLSPMEVTDEKI